MVIRREVKTEEGRKKSKEGRCSKYKTEEDKIRLRNRNGSKEREGNPRFKMYPCRIRKVQP